MNLHWHNRYPALKQLGTLPGFTVELLEPLTLTLSSLKSKSKVIVTASKGWVTDLTSVPGWAPVTKEGKWTDASIIHDVLYAKAKVKVVYVSATVNWKSLDIESNTVNCYVERAWADELYRDAMIDLGASKFRAQLYYLVLRLTGWKAWNKARRVQSENESKERPVNRVENTNGK